MNPTAVHQKVGKIMKLNADIVALSETSATHAVQSQVNKDLVGCGFHAFWSATVSSKKFSSDNRPSLRGEALGSALFTHLPSRKPRSGFTDMLWETQRISMAIVRLGGREVLFISVYGFANRYREGKKPNDLLSASLIPVITEVGLPFCILGDFNEPPGRLPSFQFFRDMGGWEAFTWYQAKTGILLPATCAGSTRNDTAIIHPWLLQFVHSMEVSSDVVFEPHSPLCMTFKFEDSQINSFTWNLPKSWAPYCPDATIIHEEYEPVDFNALEQQYRQQKTGFIDAAFLTWSRAVESAVDKALVRAHVSDPQRHVKPGLHASFKGRCCFEKKFVEVAQSRVKSDRHGGYTPPSEVFTLRSRLKVRQVRRLKSLVRRLKSLDSTFGQHGYREDGMMAAQKEWDAILSAKGYGNKWSNWILAFDAVAYLPMTVPDVETIDLVTQITEHDCNCACVEESRCRRNRFRASIQFDQEHDFSKLSYKIVKAKKTLQLCDVPIQRKVGAKLMRSRVGATALWLDEIIHIPSHSSLQFNDATLEFLEQQGQKIFFRHVSGRLGPTGTLCATFHAVTDGEILHEFEKFWKPYWQRDERQEQFQDETWEPFMRKMEQGFLPKFPAISMDMDNTKAWMALIRKLPANKAVGPCGWSNEELKSLPEICIADLVRIFNFAMVYGLSSNMMMAKTILLSKKECPQSMHDARPVTILSCLYRLFGKMIFKTVAHVWKNYFPAAISGGLPGRGVKEIAYTQKRAIEDALNGGLTCGGYSLDLIKAYNTFGRFAVAQIMIHLGVPYIMVMSWIDSLDKMVRYPTLNGQVGDGIQSTTGVPEGCSISVLAMLATSAFFYYGMCEHVMPFAYADNWSWLTRQQRAHVLAFECVKQLTDVLRLRIDHAKSWHWGTTKEFRKFCADNLTIEDGEIIVKTAVKDLGEIVHYNKSLSLGFVKEKIQESNARINRIESIPCSLQKKALMIQTSVYPMAFYSADTVYVGQHHFTTMRRAITHALVGNWHNASSVIACCGISRFLPRPFCVCFMSLCSNSSTFGQCGFWNGRGHNQLCGTVQWMSSIWSGRSIKMLSQSGWLGAWQFRYGFRTWITSLQYFDRFDQEDSQHLRGYVGTSCDYYDVA